MIAILVFFGLPVLGGLAFGLTCLKLGAEQRSGFADVRPPRD